ncbi:MAG TPA: hypothetical protein VHP33_25695 [Polyangiaceae bacterium]|nr:hypothetical protein [Polyangiaceae bacterium]
MSRWPRLGWVGVLAFATSGPACSRSSGDGATASATSAPLAPAPALPAPSLGSAPALAPDPDSVLTAEDAEEAAEHRITEQNLESELDRLEREIQAE